MRKRLLSIFTAMVMVLSLAPVTAMAGGEENSWNIANGDITVTAAASGQTVTQGDKSLTDDNPVITGTSDQYRLTVLAEGGVTARVILSNLNIVISGRQTAAIKTSGDGAVNIELDNANKLQGRNDAGIEKSNVGMLTICDDNETAGNLDVAGGMESAGIGGGCMQSGNNITITGGTVTAIGGNGGAGIGGGSVGNGVNITITGGTVTAIGGDGGAGIGGGNEQSETGGNGSNITIAGGTVTAIGGDNGAGIGAGYATTGTKSGSNITISGGNVTAIGGKYGAGIGGGRFVVSTAPLGGVQIVRFINGYGKDITISGNAQVKIRGGAGDNGEMAAGIGNGVGSDTHADEGQETGDFSGLTEGGFVEYYASDADMSTAEASYVRHYGNTERHEGDISVTEAVAATCTTTGNTLGINCSAAGANCGTVLASETVGVLPHSYKTEWTTDETAHWHACKECGAKTEEAKHTDSETKDHLCDICGIELGKCAENLTHVPAKTATVSEEGNTEYWQCGVCGKYFSDENAENEIALKDTVIAKLTPAPDNNSVKTGDGEDAFLWLALLIISGAVTAAMITRKKRVQ